MVSVSPLAKLAVVPAPTLTEPGPTSGKVKPTKYPSESVPDVSEVSKPALMLAKSKL